MNQETKEPDTPESQVQREERRKRTAFRHLDLEDGAEIERYAQRYEEGYA